MLGLIRAGIPAFLVSTRCTPLAAAALFSQTKPSIILISPDVSIRALAESAVIQLASTDASVVTPEIHNMPTFEQLYVNDAPLSPLPPRKQDLGVPRIILHSSGEMTHEYMTNY